MEEFKYKVKLTSKKELAEDTWFFEFDKPEGFDFEAGQFIQFSIPGFDEVVKRAYSIATISSDPHLSFVIKLLEGGKSSEFFRKIEVDQELEMAEAEGNFIINNEADAHHFVATGTGVVPMISMARTELETRGSDKKIHLTFGVRHDDNLFGVEDLETLAQKYSNFSYTITLSQPSEEWQGNLGRVTSHLPEDVEGTNFYLCGSAPMVIEVHKLLTEKGVEAEKIHFEIY